MVMCHLISCFFDGSLDDRTKQDSQEERERENECATVKITTKFIINASRRQRQDINSIISM